VDSPLNSTHFPLSTPNFRTTEIHYKKYLKKKIFRTQKDGNLMRETHWTVPLLLTCMRVPNCNARATVKTRIQPPRSCGSSPATNPRSGKGKDATAMGAKRNAHHRRRTQLPKRGVTAVAGYCGRKSDASEEAGPPGPTPSAAERGWTRKLQRCSSLAMKQSPDGEVTQT
jgi:hypothetical protein